MKCYQKRNSYYLFRHIHPQERCCPQCGERLVILEYLENPAYYQLQQARFILYDETEYLILLERNQLEQVEAWVETQQRCARSQPAQARYTTNPKGVLALPH